MLYLFSIKGYGVHVVIVYANSENEAWEYLAVDYSQSVESVKGQFYISAITSVKKGVLFNVVE